MSGHGSELGRDAVLQTRAAYSEHAQSYATSTCNFSRYPGLDDEIRDFIAHLNVGPVVDIGSGSGRDSLFIASLGRRVVAIDSSHALLLNLLNSDIRGSLLCGDALSLPIRSNTFAGAIVSGLLLHLPRRLCPQALAEIRRVLSVGGQVLISMKQGAGEGWRTTDEFPLPRWFTYYEPDEFTSLCTHAGLSLRKAWISAR